MAVITHPPITLDERGTAWIDDVKVKVIEVVLDRLAYGWSPEEIHFPQPLLSLAQIYAALGYYDDHQETLDAEIAGQEETVRRLRQEAGESPFVARLERHRLLEAKYTADNG